MVFLFVQDAQDGGRPPAIRLDAPGNRPCHGAVSGAVAAIAQLAWNGQRAAIQSRLHTEAVFRCETKLAEILSGVERFQSVQNVSFPGEPQWTWSAQVLSGQLPELLHVAVRVEHSGKSPVTNVGFTLERWMRDPMLFIEAAAAQAESTTTTQTSSSSSSSSSSGSSSQSSGGSAMRRASTTAGFSLLEVILSLSLSVVLLAAVSAAINQSWRMSSQGQTEMQRQQVARAVLRILERDLRSVMFVPPSEFADEDDTSSTSTTSGSSTTSSSSGSQSSAGTSAGTAAGTAAGTSAGTDVSGTSASGSSQDTLVLVSRGIRGTQTTLEIDGARPQRELAFALPVNATIPSNRTSDLRTIMYLLAAPGQAFDPQGRGGLAREEGDRYAIASAEEQGRSATGNFSAVVLAPEIIGLEFEYFDGMMWQPAWDSVAYGRLPRAVQVRIRFAPPQVKPTWLTAAVNQSTEIVRLVVYIPAADPVPEEETP